MKVEIVDIPKITSYVGIRASEYFSNLGQSINYSFKELINRQDEIKNIVNPSVTFGVSPPNYKGNKGRVDFYCCYEVSPIANVPHGMMHIHILPRTYSKTYYKGPISKTETAYDYTSNWLKENGYTYDEVEHYFERYDERTIVSHDDEANELIIYCPVKKKE
ncbi:GyrI-like domain-containing protein [Paenibacillus sp. GCM10027629]